MISTKEFLSHFTGNIEFSNGSSLVKPSPDSLCYFLAGLKEPLSRRANGNDITHKNYFIIDLDIRKDILALTGEIMSDEEIFEIADTLETTLNASPIFKDWRFISFSGNGLHLYYLQEKPLTITAQSYKRAMKRIQKLFRLTTDCPYINPDPKCINIDRIIRLPGTTNARSAYNIGSTKCRVIKHNPGIFSPLLAEMENLAKLEERDEQEKAKMHAKELKKKLAKIPKDQRERTDQALVVPIELVLESLSIIQHRGFVHDKNWIDPKDGTYYGFHKFQNIICCEGSTTFAPYSNGKNAVNTISLVMNVKNFGFKEAVEYILNLLK